VFSENDVEKQWDAFYSIFNYYFDIVWPKVRRNIANAMKATRLKKDAVIARTKLRDWHDLYIQSNKQEYRDIYKACKKNTM
jgi:hypothetical protein